MNQARNARRKPSRKGSSADFQSAVSQISNLRAACQVETLEDVGVEPYSFRHQLRERLDRQHVHLPSMQSGSRVLATMPRWIAYTMMPHNERTAWIDNGDGSKPSAFARATPMLRDWLSQWFSDHGRELAAVGADRQRRDTLRRTEVVCVGRRCQAARRALCAA
jgi:hypothetical protein